MDKVNDALAIKERVFADGTHLNSSSRLKVISHLKNIPSEISVIWIDTPFEQCCKQNNQRTGRAKVPENAIQRMQKRMSPPTKEEHIDFLYKITNNKIEKIKL